jgi:hypothetical protein
MVAVHTEAEPVSSLQEDLLISGIGHLLWMHVANVTNGNASLCNTVNDNIRLLRTCWATA